MLIPGENIWLFIHNVLRGLFGDWALILAVLMLYVAVTKAFEKTGLYRGARMVFVCLILFFWCAAVHLFGNAALPEGMGFFETIGYLYTRGVESGGAGLVGGMLGAPLARATEAPGKGTHWGSEARHQTLPRGYRTTVGTVGPLEQVLFGPSHQADGKTNFIGALKRAMASTGYVDVKNFQRCGMVVNPYSAR